MKKISLFIFASWLLLPQNTLAQVAVANQFGLKIVQEIPCTPIKSQDNTGTCWSYSTSSFLESELMRLGKGEHDLAEMFVARQIYVEKALNYVRRQGKTQFGQGSLSHDVMNVIRKYGIVPQAAFAGKKSDADKHDHNEMEALLKGILDAVIKQKEPSPYWLNAYQAVLDVYLGKIPTEFTYLGKKYTPKSFASELVGINPDDYIEISSYVYYPDYKPFVLDAPDNFSNGIYYNVPLEDLEIIVDNAIKLGQSIAWDCDVSEKGFSQKQGLAILPLPDADPNLLFIEPSKELPVTPEMRQHTYDNFSTTDDHLMHITGIAKDKNGAKYYLVKNSWGETGPFKGFLYASQAYFRLKTVAIMVHKSALPKDIAKKLGV